MINEYTYKLRGTFISLWIFSHGQLKTLVKILRTWYSTKTIKWQHVTKKQITKPSARKQANKTKKSCCFFYYDNILCNYTPAEVDHVRLLASVLCTGDLVPLTSRRKVLRAGQNILIRISPLSSLQLFPQSSFCRAVTEQKPDKWGENINSNLLVSTCIKQTEWKLKEERSAQLLSCNKYAAAQNN